MPRTTGFAVLAAAAAPLLLMGAAPAGATEEDVQVWSYFSVAGSPFEKVDAAFEISPRSRNGEVGGDVLQTRISADYRAAPGLSLGGGLTYAEFAAGSEWRPHQQAVVALGDISFRTRLEERFFDGADRMELRLRQRVQASLPLTERTSLLGSGEVFGILRPRNRSGDARVEQWRAMVSLRQRWTPRIDMTASYLLIYAPDPVRENRVSHVPILALTYRL